MDTTIHTFLEEIHPTLKKWRRTFHQYPELGWTEYVTTYIIGKELKKLGFSLFVGRNSLHSTGRMGVPKAEVLQAEEGRARTAGVPENWLDQMQGGHTGLVAQWDTGKSGPHIALRFDIDALPIVESSNGTHIPFKQGFNSTYEGKMHACGHDGHAAIGLGTASFIARFSSELTGRFTLMFQPAEEGSRGARAMVEKGWLDDVHYFFSGHIGIHSLEIGDLAATTDKFFATTKMNVSFKGASSHAGVSPHTGKNAVLAAAAATVQLHSISRHGEGDTRINVGKIEAGNGRNIIGDFGRLEIETRGETTALNEYMVNEAKRIIQAIAVMYDVKAQIEIVGEGLGATCNSESVNLVNQACHTSNKIKQIYPVLPLGGSEDVTYMINHVQNRGGIATYLLFGTPLVENHHHPEFDFNEEVLPIAVETYTRLLFAVLKDYK